MNAHTTPTKFSSAIALTTMPFPTCSLKYAQIHHAKQPRQSMVEKSFGHTSCSTIHIRSSLLLGQLGCNHLVRPLMMTTSLLETDLWKSISPFLTMKTARLAILKQNKSILAGTKMLRNFFRHTFGPSWVLFSLLL